MQAALAAEKSIPAGWFKQDNLGSFNALHRHA
jgi:hypothetical protein